MCFQGEVTLESALDWLCLNLPADELPIKFSSGVRAADVDGPYSYHLNSVRTRALSACQSVSTLVKFSLKFKIRLVSPLKRFLIGLYRASVELVLVGAWGV